MNAFVHEWFAAHAAARGDAVAIDAGSRTLTYADLDRASTRLARSLAARLAPGTLVGVFTDDPIEIVISVLAILQAGAAFVPMEPSSGIGRLALLSREIDLTWWIAAPSLVEKLEAVAMQAGRRFNLLSIDADAGHDAAGEDRLRVQIRRPPDDLCYVYFTSGSTGHPKGIAGRLKAIDHFIRWEISAIGASADVRVSQLTSPVFDAYLRDVFLPLCAGGVLCVPPDPEVRGDASRLIAWLRDSRVTVVHCVPSLLRSLLRVSEAEAELPALRHVLTSGEPLLPVDVRAWMSRYGAHARLTNLYGPSETTMVKFAYEVKPDDAERTMIPIGRPIDGTRAIVLNARGQVCLPGVSGEIYIRTPYRSLGYYGRPDLTAEVFVPNPFGSDPTDLIYRTGDLGRVLEDGTYEFLGRRDRQVKIRGMRVELAEIENVIRREPRVQDCCVIDRELPDGSKSLCACVVLREGLTRHALAAQLRDLLPELMMPVFVELSALPRTPSGKVDRQALEALAMGAGPLDDDGWTPRTPVEDLVAMEWARALGVDRVPLHHDFFRDLGGHSLLATQVLQRLQPLFDVPLQLRWLFEAPTVATFSASIDRALTEAAGASESEPVLARAARDGVLPLSFGQERVWMVDQVIGTRAYHVPLALALGGTLNASALRAAVTGLATRHEILRTTIDVVDGRPVQHIAPPAAVSLPCVDLSGIDVDNARRMRVQRGVVRQLERAAFDLRAGPLWRVALIRREPTQHVLSCTLHHIAADGWSIGVLLRDLSALYEAACTGEPARVPELSVQYADYALWERQALSGARLQAQLEYWTRQLHDVAPLALPTDRPRRSMPSGEGAVVWRKWPPALTARVYAYGRANGATLFMVLMAGWQALLARYARQRDVAVGVPVAQRPRPELEPLVGFFLNTIVLRTQVRGSESWRALTTDVRAQALAAYAHQLVPFEQVIAALQPERQLGRTPLFQVLFVLQNLPTPGEQPTALRLEVLESRSTGAKFDLELAVKSRGDDLMCRLEYAVDLFDRERIERMLGHLEMLMASALDAPEAPLDELSCLTPAERAQIVHSWNATAVDWPADDAVAWMETQATRTPEAIAVEAEAVNGPEAWSHAHLHAEANRIARRLQRLRVGPESRVGIWMSRSPLMVACVLGTVKAGAAYVPLDPRYPAARLVSQVADADVAVVLTDASSRAAIPAGPYSVELLDAPDAAWRTERATPLAFERGRAIVDPAQLAYVIYTSGSTGRPKGAMNTHAGLVNRLRWMQALYGVAAGDRVLQKTSISFDVSVWELFLPLAAGATMVLARPDGQQDPTYLARTIAQSGVTVAHFVPSMLEAFVAAGGLASCATLRLLVSSGEALPRRLAAQVRDEWPGRLENLYGPTEAAVDVTAHRVEADDAAVVVPIGRPVANTHIHLVERAGQPVPIGVDGELCIGGVQVGRGYWAQPALTAERFTPDPFAETPGARLYRSGDLARARPTGAIEYIGRIDHQVKLRGNRIELGEIEAVLRHRPEVRDAVVVLRESSTGERRLVAFVVPRGGDNGPVQTDTIQQGLRQQLPDYMVPAAIVSIDALPLTPSGKIDRQRLPVESVERPALAVSYAAPRTEIERTLARLWADVLRRPQIGLHDNFFALGGDSILGLQIVARARESGLHLLPQQVFQYQTIAELALAAESASPQAPSASLAETPIADAPLTPIQRWFFELEPDVPDHFNQAVLLAGGPDLPPQVWEASITALVARHEALRLRISRTDTGEWRQRCAAIETHRVFMQVDLAETGSASLRWVTRISSRVQRSLNLAGGPIVRVVAFRGPTRDTDRILIVVHHAAIDGVSWRTLVDELSRTAAPRPSSFLRWASHLASRATALAPEVRAYWAGAAARGRDLHIPRDHDTALNRIRSQRSHSVTFSAAETQEFLQQPPRAYRMQAHEVLIAAAASALSVWSGLRNAWIALESHGRDVLDDDDDVSRTVGCFTSLFPVCVTVPDGSPDEMLIAVKEGLRRVPRSGLDYGLWRYGVAGADARDMPDVLVNYFGQFDQVLDAGGWRLANESAGHSRHPAGRRPFLLEINGGVIAGQLQVTVGYSLDCHRSETIAAFVDLFAARLRALVEHCRTTPWTRTTPIDVPMADLAQRELDALAETGGEIEDVYPLSPMQEGLLFHSVFEPDREVYFQQFRVTLEGDLDVEALQQAWAQVITRHAVLRTAFVWEERPRPLQVVYAHVPLAAAQHDWRDLEADIRAARLRELLEADRARGFRLDRVPLLRLAFLRLAERRWEMVWSYHHILIDGWCVPLVFKEVATAYEARRVGREAVLPPVARFRTYIGWLRQQDTAQAKAYWRGVLDGVDEPVTILPSPRTGDEERAKPTDYDHRSRVVPAPTVAAVHDLARRAHLTLNTVVQGAWALLLARYAGVAEVIFGATSSGRPTTLPGIEAMIGLFINTLPVRVSAPSRAQTGPWLQALQAAQAEARQFEYTPLADIQAWSGIPHGLPLFESILAFENYPVDDELVRGQASFGIAKAQVFEKTNYPITVQVSPASGLSLRMLFDGRRLEGATAERMLAQVERLLAGLASAGADARLGDLSLMADDEREQVLRGWNPPATRPADCDLLAGGLLLTALEAQAASTPDAVAIVEDEGCVTYQTLHARADRWASHLRADGVGPEVPVAVCVEPGADLIAALLAVWKAGGAYVPLEPRAPADRLTYIVRDVRARVLITTYALASTVVVPGLRVICIDLDGAWVSGALAAPAAAMRPAMTPEHLAYVIYTSGSTGRPKGVAVTHGNVTSLFASSDARVACAADDVWTLFHSAAFDFSVWEMWGALRTGGRLVIVPYAIARTPESFVALLYREQVTVLNQTPSAFRGVMAADTADAAAAAIDASSRLPLRVVIFGGEGLDPRILRDWSLRYGFERPALINMYGITETTVHVTCYRVTAMDVTGAAGSRIGQSLPSLQAYVRDGTGQPAPIGVAGELFVGGAGVARGYVGRPDLTAQRFVPDPFSLTPGRRLYRTGDRARWQPDGVLEHLGRLDDQIKLRGYRIEPGEIEAVLREYPGVRDSVVLLREDTPGDRRLVAYVVAQVAAQSDRETTREWEAQQIAQWERVFEENYLPPVAPAAAPVDPTFNIAGWNSSETGLPIPAHEMREWVDETVADLLDGQPRRVLEIGCGTGLLLLRIAPRCESYVATDISASVLQQVQQQVDAAGLTARVTLHQQAADDLDRLTDADRFDLVILNSVVQYFPSAAYLTRVLERAAALVAPGGRIYIGDVRSLPLLPLFHQAVQRHQAPGWLSRRAFERRVERQLHQETELVLSPEFFLRLSETLASIGDVEIRPKRGAARNELTAFRYQVMLHVGEPAVEIDAVWLDWHSDALTIDELLRIMHDARPAALGVSGVPNVRLQQDLAFAAALAQADPDVTLDEIRVAATREATSTMAAATMHPQALAAAARDAGYAMAFDWSRHRGDGAFDITLTREDLARGQGSGRRVRPLTREPGDAPSANNPLLAQAGRHLGPVLRRFTQERLPSYMVPAAFVVLDRLPVTANGKLDRRALAPPDFARPELEQAYVAPRTPLEAALAQIWMDSLRVQQIGIHDNFFELGGDSIISIQLVARANRAGMPLTPKLLFEHPTIARIAAIAETWTATPAGDTNVVHAASVESPQDLGRALGLDLAIDDAYPLSPMQQGMVFHTVDAPDAGVYVAQLCYALTGDIDRSALRAAWQLVVQRHPALRTAFAWDQTRTPLQMVCRDVEVPWDERDWRGVPDREQGERLRALLRADRSRGFDLTRPPLMRLMLIRTGVETWELIWSHHHLLLDGWSLPIVSREVLESYEALRRGATPYFEPPVPYRFYIDWLAQCDEQAAERYWRNYLHSTPSLRLPFTSVPSVSSSIAAASRRILVNARRTAALKRWARTRQITLNTLLQGIWAMTLSRLGEQDDVLFGGVVSGRPPALAGSDRCVGLFINTLPVRIFVDPDAKVIPWMRTVQAQQVAQREFEFVPLMRVKGWSDAPADAPLFETLLVFENYPADPMRQGARGSGGEVRGSSYHMTETYALVLSVGPGRQIALELKYDSRRIDAAWIERVRAMLDAALDAATRGPAVRVADVLRAMQRADDELREAGEARGQQTMTELLGVTRRSAERRTTRRRRDEVRSRTPRQ